MRKILTFRLTEAWYDAAVWLVFLVVGLLLSAGIAGLASAAAHDFAVSDFTDGGQFAVYTAGTMVGTFFLLNRPKKPPLPRAELFAIGTLLLFATAVAFVTLATLALRDPKIDREIFRLPSVGLFLVSALVAFLAVGFDNKRIERVEKGVEEMDPRGAQQEALNTLREDFQAGEGDENDR